MFDELDEVLRKLLMRELAIKNGEVDIAFDQPRREWSAKLSRPTLNLFLYDLRENRKLRQTQPMWQVEGRDQGTVTQRRQGVRADLCYMITAWANEAEDEHSLLSRSWLALLRYPHLPKEMLPESLREQPLPIPVVVAQHEELRNPSDIWNVMDNEMRPAVACTITLCLDPYLALTTPVVRSFERRLGPTLDAPSQQFDVRVEPYRTWTIGGNLASKQPLETMHVTLLERGQEVAVQSDGRFAIGPLREGIYTLEVRANGGKPRQFKITVPAADCTLEV